MALNVNPLMTASPLSIPAAGGTTTVTFEASTFGGGGQLQASYALNPNAGYTLVGSTQLPPAAVSVIPRNYDQPLTFQRTSGGAANVVVNITVEEVGTGVTIPGHCLVNIDISPGVLDVGGPQLENLAFAAPAELPVGARLKAHRNAKGLSQKAVADQLGVSRHQVSRIERGVTPSAEIRGKLEKMMGG